MNRCFSKGDTGIAYRHMKECSTSLIIQEMQKKTRRKCHLTPVKAAIIKRLQITNVPKMWRKGTRVHSC